MEKPYKAQNTIIGAGIAGLTAAIELIEKRQTVILIERDMPENLGGLQRNLLVGCFILILLNKKD